MGHRVVAKAAQEILSENAKRRLGYLLGSDAQLAEIAYWADEIIAERPETDAWHSIHVPPGAKRVILERDCPLGDCLTAKIRECIGIIRLSVRSKSEIIDAFKLLVNLAADLHQPLRNGYPPAHGKEVRLVVLDGREMQLFEAWDSELLGALGSEDEVLDLVREKIVEADRRVWTKGNPRTWTWESHRVAVDQVYPMIRGSRTEFGEPALQNASTILVDQLAKAAVRLSHMLDLAWP